MINKVICPDGESCSIGQCLVRCRLGTRCVPAAYAFATLRERDWNGTPSVTQLIAGTRQMYLKLTHDYPVKLKERTFMMHGTNVHSMLEGAQCPNVILVETRLTYQGITGQIDALEKWSNEYVLIDYKTSGSFQIQKMLGLVEKKVPALDEDGAPVVKNGKIVYEKKFVQDDTVADKWEYNMQLNMYRLMIEANYDIKVDKMFNAIIVRDGGTYVAHNRGVSELFYLIEQEKQDDEYVIDYFTKKRDALLHALEADEMPPLCDARETWGGRKCENFCEVSFACDYKNYKGE